MRRRRWLSRRRLPALNNYLSVGIRRSSSRFKVQLPRFGCTAARAAPAGSLRLAAAHGRCSRRRRRRPLLQAPPFGSRWPAAAAATGALPRPARPPPLQQKGGGNGTDGTGRRRRRGRKVRPAGAWRRQAAWGGRRERCRAGHSLTAVVRQLTHAGDDAADNGSRVGRRAAIVRAAAVLPRGRHVGGRAAAAGGPLCRRRPRGAGRRRCGRAGAGAGGGGGRTLWAGDAAAAAFNLPRNLLVAQAHRRLQRGRHRSAHLRLVQRPAAGTGRAEDARHVRGGE